MATVTGQQPNVVSIKGKQEPRISLILREQLAAQAVAVIDAHWKRPDVDEKLAILKAAAQQVEATRSSI